MGRMAGGKAIDRAEPVSELESLRAQLSASGRELDEQRARAQRLDGQVAALSASQRQMAAGSARANAALDRLSASVMLVDADQRVLFVNRSLLEMFHVNAAAIRGELSGFEIDALVGSKIDALRVPADSIDAGAADLSIGDLRFTTTASALRDAEGQRLGTVIEWTDRTQDVAFEADVMAVVSAAQSGDIHARIRSGAGRHFHGRLGAAVNGLLGNLSDLMAQLRTAASAVHVGAAEIAAGNTDLSQRTERTAASLEQTARSMEQMTSTVRLTAQNAGQANQLAMAARQQAEKGGSVVGAAVAAMSGINGASKKIADIIGVIDEIAFQTNLLALNAAVEAARAGEQGRGFAVVATEVRNLAGRSAVAAKEIKALIRDSVAKVDEGSQLVNESGRTLAEIVGAVKKVTDIVAEIAAASREQSAGIEQVNKAILEMDATTQQNATLVQHATSASHAIVDHAQSLRALIDRSLGETDRSPMRAPPKAPARVLARAPVKAPQKAPLKAPPKTNFRAAPAVAAAPVRRAVNQSAAADQEWQEF